MGSSGVFEDPFEISYVDTSSTGWALVAFYVVMIVIQIPTVITAIMRIAKSAPTCGWLASEQTPEAGVHETYGAVSAGGVSQVDVVQNGSSQTTQFDSQVVPQSVPNTSGLVSTQEAEPGSSAWYTRRSPDAPPPPKGWQG